jgi:hypothetical protein
VRLNCFFLRHFVEGSKEGRFFDIFLNSPKVAETLRANAHSALFFFAFWNLDARRRESGE